MESEIGGPGPVPGTPDVPAPPTPRRGIERSIGSVSRGTAVMMAATIVLVALQFLTRVLVTRNISGNEWGEFNLGLAFANFLALLAAFGIPTATARSLAFEETMEARVALIRKALTISVPVAVVASVVVYFAAPSLATLFHEPAGLAAVFQLFSISIGLTILSNVLVGVFQGLERAEPNALFIQIVNPSLFLAFVALFLFYHVGFTGVLAAYVLSWAGAFGALAVYSYRKLPPLLRSVSSEAFTGDASARVGFAALTVTLFGVATLTYLTSYADTILLGVFQPEQIVGEYSSAMNLTRLLLVGTGTVTFIYLPVTARLRRERDFASIRGSYVTVTRWMALLTIPFTFLFAFDPAYSLAFTFGPGQVGGAQALQVLVVANTLAILLGPSTSTLGGLARTREVLQFTVISATTNIVLCFVLIPPFGMLGAAYAWAAARVLFPGLALIRVYQLHGVTPFRAHFLKPLAVALVVLVPLYALVLPHPSLLFVALFLAIPLVVFAGAILLTRSVDQGDVFFVRAAERRVRALGPLRRLLESRLARDATADGWPVGS